MISLIVTKENTFADITEMVRNMDRIGMLGVLTATTEVYAYYPDDDTEALIESVEDLESALDDGLRIVLEVKPTK